MSHFTVAVITDEWYGEDTIIDILGITRIIILED